MKKVKGSLAHPGYTVVKLQGGSLEGRVRPWTMAQRAELKPILLELLELLSGLDKPNGELSLAAIFSEAEDEFTEIARLSVELPKDAVWDDLYWEDVPVIIQAVWETSLVRDNGTGLMGKVMGVLATALTAAVQQAKDAQSNQSMSTSSKPVDSPSSPDAGGQPQTPSATP
jgi:hypothetical protein